MLNMNYKIEAIDELLQKDCVLARMYPLIPYKQALIEHFRAANCLTKEDCQKLSEEALLSAGLPDAETAKLFKRFLGMYDIKLQKLKEIDAVCQTPEEAESFRELYHLPGVKRVRAELYFRSGFRSLREIADAFPEDIIARTAETIESQHLDCIVPLKKEVKTHIAVEKAFTYYRVD